jgi:N-acyl-D-amino-acid deacylase
VEPPPESKVSQGITTEVIGNCGFSGAPCFGEVNLKINSKCREYKVKAGWKTVGEYIQRLLYRGLLNNVVLLVGHGNLRGSTLGYKNKKVSKREINQMKSLLSSSLDEGAIGLSSGLFYPPGCYASTQELIELAKVVASKDGIYAFHLRNERALKSLEEAIKIGKETGVKIQISHLKSSSFLSIIEEAQRERIKISCDIYPYTASHTDLNSILPSWVWEGGVEEEIKRLKDNFQKEKVKKEIPENKEYWEKVFISKVTLPKNRWMEGRSIWDIAKGKDVREVVCDLLVEERGKVEANFFFGDEEELKRILKNAFTMIGTDASSISREGILSLGRPHPRAFGTFARLLGKYVREEGLLSLEDAIYKMTLMPLSLLGLRWRGRVEEGWIADLVIFDPKKIKDLATYRDPFQCSDGVCYTIVNGYIVWEKGSLTGKRPGEILRKE